MSLRKWCGCPDCPKCDHEWFYDFRVNGRRYRATTDTANKGQAKDIEARERSRILDGRHGIRRQPDITFKAFAAIYLRDHAELNTRSGARERLVVNVLNRTFGGLILHEITPHRIEQWKRARLQARWSGRGQTTSRPIAPGTVNRELDTLRVMFSKAVEWGYLIESAAHKVKRLRLENRRTRILSPDEQRALLDACPRKLRAVVLVALITGARIGEILGLRWEDCGDGHLTFWKTKNGKVRRVEITPSLQTVLDGLPQTTEWVFSNKVTGQRYTVGGARNVFLDACARAGLGPDVTLHTLRHTALSRMIAAGFDDYTVMEISGHSTTRMLARYTHPTAARKQGALETFGNELLGQDLGSTARQADQRDAKQQELLRILAQPRTPAGLVSAASPR
jgi:integrase